LQQAGSLAFGSDSPFLFCHKLLACLPYTAAAAPVPTRNVSVRLPVTDIERARKVAQKQGVGYQTVIKRLLHEALKKESRTA